jgi:hypothetical protein
MKLTKNERRLMTDANAHDWIIATVVTRISVNSKEKPMGANMLKAARSLIEKGFFEEWVSADPAHRKGIYQHSVFVFRLTWKGQEFLMDEADKRDAP